MKVNIAAGTVAGAIQRDIHAYNAATGVDLSVEIIDTRLAAISYRQPSLLIADRLARQSPARLTGSSQRGLRAPQADELDLRDVLVSAPGRLPRKV